MTYDRPIPADAPRLADLAEHLNRARWTANSIEAIAPQYSVYGQIEDALHQTVEVYLVAVGVPAGDELEANVSAIRQFMLDGATFIEALALLTERGAAHWSV